MSGTGRSLVAFCGEHLGVLPQHQQRRFRDGTRTGLESLDTTSAMADSRTIEHCTFPATSPPPGTHAPQLPKRQAHPAPANTLSCKLISRTSPTYQRCTRYGPLIFGPGLIGQLMVTWIFHKYVCLSRASRTSSRISRITCARCLVFCMILSLISKANRSSMYPINVSSQSLAEDRPQHAFVRYGPPTAG